MKSEGIRDVAGLELWLNTRPDLDARAIAARASLRALPLWDFFYTEDVARKYLLTPLPILRLGLASSVAQKYPSVMVTPAAQSAFASQNSKVQDIGLRNIERHVAFPRPERALKDFADSTEYQRVVAASSDAARSILAATAGEAADAAAAAAADSEDIWREICADASRLEQGQDPFSFPLWSEAADQRYLAYDKSLQAWMTFEFGSPNSFWHRWWDGMKRGQPLNWDLQRDVALIDEAIWEEALSEAYWRQEPEPVIKAIAAIEERYDLRAEVTALRIQLQEYQTVMALHATAAQRSHNQPPELIEPQVLMFQQVAVIVGELEVAEVELAKSVPSTSVLRRIARTLMHHAKIIALYCGGLADTVLQNAAKEVGTTGAKWAFRVGGLTVLSEALVELAKSLYGG